MRAWEELCSIFVSEFRDLDCSVVCGNLHLSASQKLKDAFTMILDVAEEEQDE